MDRRLSLSRSPSSPTSAESESSIPAMPEASASMLAAEQAKGRAGKSSSAFAGSFDQAGRPLHQIWDDHYICFLCLAVMRHTKNLTLSLSLSLTHICCSQMPRLGHRGAIAVLKQSTLLHYECPHRGF